MKYLILFFLVCPIVAFAEDGTGTGGSIIDAISEMVSFISDGVYETADNILQRIAFWYIIWSIEAKLFFLDIAVGIAEFFVSSLGISEALDAALSAIDPKISEFIFYLRIPEAFNIILSAHVTRYIMSMI